MNEEHLPFVSRHRRVVSMNIMNNSLGNEIANQSLKYTEKSSYQTPFAQKKQKLKLNKNFCSQACKLVNKVCIDSKIALGLTRFSHLKVRVKNEPKFLLKVISQSQMVKRNKKDFRVRDDEYLRNPIERKNNMGNQEKPEISEKILKAHPMYSKLDSGVYKHKSVNEEKTTVFNGSQSRETSEKQPELNKKVTIIETPTILLQTLQMPEEPAEKHEDDYFSYKKKFKIRPRYTQMPDIPKF